VWALYLRGWHLTAVAFAAFACLVGWPFALVAFMPLAVGVFGNREMSTLVVWVSVLGAALICTAVTDTWFYGRWTLSPWNNFRYAIGFLYPHKANDLLTQMAPEYTSWQLYLKTLAQNFHFALPLLVMTGSSIDHLSQGIGVAALPLIHIPFWFLIISVMSFKKEHFLSIVYPNICLGVAITAQRFHLDFHWPHPRYLLNRMRVRRKTIYKEFIFALVLLAVVLGSISRTVAIEMRSAPPVRLWATAKPVVQEKCNNSSLCIICMGKEWRLFPGSVFLPPHTQLAFVMGDVQEHVPAPFKSYAPMAPLQPNIEHRYVPQQACSFAVDNWETEMDPMLWPPDSPGDGIGVPVRSAHCETMMDLYRSPEPWRSFWVPGSRIGCISYNIVS